MANIWAVHHNPRYWKTPEKFLPERHLDGKGNFIPSNNVMVFGVGPRHCLGEQLARMEVFLFLVTLIQRFEFLSDPKDKELADINRGSPGTAFSPVFFKLVAKER